VSHDPSSPALRPPPPGFVLRHPTWDDLDAVAALFAAFSLDRVGAITVRPDDLRVRWLGLDGLDDALLIEHPEAVPPLVAYAATEVGPDPWTGVLDLYLDGRVHPTWTGHGLATFLLGRATDQLRTEALAVGQDTAVLRTTVDDGDAPARAFFAARGFVPVRHLLELRLDLHAAPPRPAWPPGVTCRTFEPGRDEERVWRVHQAAFADVPTADPMPLDDFVEDRLRRDPAFDPGLVLLAEHDGEAIGLAVCRAGSEGAAEDGWVRDLGVVPAWRRRGVAMALLRAAFAAFRVRELTGVALEVDDVTIDGAVQLYRRAGMRIVRRTDVIERIVDARAGA
jgi:mycothiol synthase